MSLPKRRIYIDILCLFVVLISTLVMIGWYKRFPLFVQPSSTFTPMYFNTALCFIFCSFSLWALNHNQSQKAVFFILPLLFISTVTLLAYVFNAHSFLDELFVRAFVRANSPFPGRMAPNTAFSFVLFAISLILTQKVHSVIFNPTPVIVVINYLIISLSILSLIGYFTNLVTSYGIGQLTKMALGTAICFMALSVAQLLYLRRQEAVHCSTLITFLLPFVFLNISYLGWQSIRNNQENNLTLMLQQASNNMSNYIQLSLRERAAAFERISYRWLNNRAMTREEWEKDAYHYVKDQAGYIAIERVDSRFIIQWIVPRDEHNDKVIGYDLYKDARRRTEIDASLQTRKLRLSPALDLIQGGKGVIFFSPLYEQEQFYGLMVGVIDTAILFHDLFNRLGKNDFSITVKDKTGILFTNNHSTHNHSSFNHEWSESAHFSVYGQPWEVIIAPSSALYQQILSPLIPSLILIVGFILAALSGFLMASFFSIKKLQIIAGDALERLNGIIEGSSELIAAVDLNFNLMALNQSYRSELFRIFHFDLKPGMNINILYSFMPEENKKRAIELWKNAFSGKPFTVIEPFLDINHPNRQYEIRYSPIYNIKGELIGACHIASNITKRLEHEQQIKEDRNKLQILVENLKEKSNQLLLLKEFTNILHSSMTIEQTKETISVYAKKLFPQTAGVFYLFHSKKRSAEVEAVWNHPVIELKTITSPECLALTQTQPYFVANTEEDLNCSHVRCTKRPVSYICIPLLAKNEVLGLVYVEFEKRADDEEIEFILLYCEQIALVLANIKLQDILRFESIRDPLTGLYNRRYFEEQVEQAILTCRRTDDVFGIMILDIDHFKLINDRYGHWAGDKALCCLSDKMRHFFRESDIIGRWGGEEFIILLKNLSQENIVKKAEQLRQDIETLRIDINGTLISFTISIGIASFTPQTDKEQIINNADAALYKAKNKGRNKVVAFPF
ncbi:diguanylate cyclase [Legionella worsleiensis]|uniref:diguanylate cyclase n=1 Tax=Legionella worsleiensis TaxID=45076 RepID=A0A0W1AAI4_9GAMM|nr:diguanylate cyclase [Legionella worsleiensis]KTD78296.1 sensor histidine kinase [Legionella worsleiensis]STY32633.1 sensor histidine kinase [Legionella worsleiensis]